MLQVYDSKDGEMAEWSMAHAWKRFRRTASSNTRTLLRAINSATYVLLMLLSVTP